MKQFLFVLTFLLFSGAARAEVVTIDNFSFFSPLYNVWNDAWNQPALQKAAQKIFDKVFVAKDPYLAPVVTKVTQGYFGLMPGVTADPITIVGYFKVCEIKPEDAVPPSELEQSNEDSKKSLKNNEQIRAQEEPVQTAHARCREDFYSAKGQCRGEVAWKSSAEVSFTIDSENCDALARYTLKRATVHLNLVDQHHVDLGDVELR